MSTIFDKVDQWLDEFAAQQPTEGHVAEFDPVLPEELQVDVQIAALTSDGKHLVMELHWVEDRYAIRLPRFYAPDSLDEPTLQVDCLRVLRERTGYAGTVSESWSSRLVFGRAVIQMETVLVQDAVCQERQQGTGTSRFS